MHSYRVIFFDDAGRARREVLLDGVGDADVVTRIQALHCASKTEIWEGARLARRIGSALAPRGTKRAVVRSRLTHDRPSI